MDTTRTPLPSAATPAPSLLPTSPTALAALVVVATAAPLCQLLWALSVPYAMTDGEDAVLAAVLADPAAFELSLLTQVLYGVFGVTSMLVVGAVVRRGAPRFGGVATVVGVLGASVGWAAMAPAAILGGQAAGLDPAAVQLLAEEVDALVPSAVTAVLFLGIPLGTLLLGLAALLASRRGAVPLWSAVLLAVSMPAVAIGGFVSTAALASGWALVTVGTAAVASGLVRPAPSGR